MTFPVIEATNASQVISNTTSHLVNLPSGIQSGDLLIVFFAADGNPTVTWPNEGTDWIQLADFSGPSSRVRLSCAYRDADGDEGVTITVTTSADEQSAHCAYRISGAEDPATQAPEISGSTTGTSTAPDSTSLTPTGGANDYLYLSAMAADRNRTVDGFPSNMATGPELNVNGGSVNHCSMGVDVEEENAASFDPTAFTISASDEWIAATLAVHPAVAAATDDEEWAGSQNADPPRPQPIPRLHPALQPAHRGLGKPIVPFSALQQPLYPLPTPPPARGIAYGGRIAAKLTLTDPVLAVLSSALAWNAMDNPANTVTSDAFEVVVDKTGNGRDLIQTTSTLRPARLDTSGVISAEYDAIDDVLVGVAADWDFSWFDPVGAYGLVLRADSTGEGTFGHWYQKGDNTRAWTDNESAGDQDLQVNINGATQADITTNANRPITQTQRHIVFLTYDGSDPISDGVTIHVDGVSIGLDPATPGALPLTDTSGSDFLLGNRVAGDRTWDGGFYELAYWSRALTAGDRTIVEAFWGDKYGVSV